MLKNVFFGMIAAAVILVGLGLAETSGVYTPPARPLYAHL